VISEAKGGKPKAVIIATGSEVDIALKAQAAMEAEIPVRVVSMPSTNVFDRQDAAYRESVLPRGVPRVAIEAGVTDGWYKYVGLDGVVIGLDRFGESAPAGQLFKEFGFTAGNVVKAVEKAHLITTWRSSKWLSKSVSTVSVASAAWCFALSPRKPSSRTSRSSASTTCWSPTTWPTC
jgi:pyruvate dehydrogenase complex dehydrogenase (E1) component